MPSVNRNKSFVSQMGGVAKACADNGVDLKHVVFRVHPDEAQELANQVWRLLPREADRCKLQAAMGSHRGKLVDMLNKCTVHGVHIEIKKTR